ncbi:hypothetical protein ACE1OA_30890 [Streptomyces sp. JL2001]|uniref:hypothetical protein n=1 Tax=Streptomyces sp. JL2001 TaxID=3342488 RepID=UPI003D801EFD
MSRTPPSSYGPGRSGRLGAVPVRPGAPAPVPTTVPTTGSGSGSGSGEERLSAAVRAARGRLAAGALSATVLGPGAAATLGVLARELVGLVSVTVHPEPASGPPRWPDAESASYAAREGIVLTTEAALDRALLGADLVVLAPGAHRPVPSPVRLRALSAPGSVVLDLTA